MTERVLAALTDPSPAEEAPRRIPVGEFRTIFAASGLKQVALARGVPVKPGTVANWMHLGVKATSALRVRYVLTHPEEFRHLVAPRGHRTAKPKAMSGRAFRALVSASGLTSPEVAAVLGVRHGVLRGWSQSGVSADVAAEACAVFGDAVPALPLRREELRALMQREELTVAELALRCGVRDGRIRVWRSEGVPARWSESVAMHIAGDPDAPPVGGSKDPQRIARRTRVRAAITTAAPIPGHEFARLLSATGLMQTELGDLVGVRQATVSRWKGSEVPAWYADGVMEVLRELDVKV